MKCTNVGFSRLVEEERGNEDQHKELGFQVHLLDAGQNERDQQTDDYLDYRDGDVHKLVDYRGSRDAGQDDEHKLKCLHQASFLVVGGNDGEPAAGVEQRVRGERRVRDERRVHEGSEHTGLLAR